MPGWVQAMGRTAEQMNPPLEALRARRMALLEHEAGIAEKAGALNIAALRTLEGQAERKEAKALREQTAATNLENQLRDDFTKGLEKEATRAEKSRVFDESSIDRIVSLGRRLKRSEEEIASSVDAVRAAAEGGVQAYKDRQDEWDRQQKVAAAQHLATARAMIPIEAERAKATEKAKQDLLDPMIDRVARSLVAGNLTSIRDVTSFRGDQRLRLNDRLLELDPKFSIA